MYLVINPIKAFKILIYWSSNSKHLHKDFLQKLSNTLSIISNTNKETIIVGDVNANYLDKRNRIPLKELFQLNSYKQTIKTHITVESETLIHVVLTNASSNLTKSQVITSFMSDHEMIMCKRKINNIKFSAKVVYCRDFSHNDTNTVRNELSHERWVNVYNRNDPNIAWQNLKLKLTEVIDQHLFPSKLKPGLRRKSNRK